jgi:hypothetical protein
MHSFKSGMILNLAEVSYLGLTQSKWNEFKKDHLGKVGYCQSSMLSDYPWGQQRRTLAN